MSEKIEEIRNTRIQKLKKFRKKGVDPYPVSTKRTHVITELVSDFDKLAKAKNKITLVGRIRSIRVHGKLTFGNIEDATGTIQFMLRADDLSKEAYEDFGSLFDMGDFVQVTGSLMLSKTKEKTLKAESYEILSKSIRPVPDDFYGLKDTETKLRKRYLDLMTSERTRELFRKKSLFWQTIREFLIERGFMEVDLNILEEVPGGAEAEPFSTHHNSLGRDFYLRISLELPHKKLLVGGFEKIFEIGRIFRNEGISTEHLQDYTQLEFYWAYSDYEELMDMSEKMYQTIVKVVTGGLKTECKGKAINWAGKWSRLDYFELFKKNTGIDLNKADEKILKAYAKKEKINFEKTAGKGRVIDTIFKKKVRPKLWDPSFIVNPPIEIEPLAKKNPENNKQVQRMQIMACGTELGKGFSELNDPLDQRERFEEQMKLRQAGDKEAQMMDEDFVEALEYGMPPASGFGLSERLFSVIMDKSIRETQFAPPMKEQEIQSYEKKSQESKMAVAVINQEAKLAPWQELNTIAHLTAELGVREGRHLLLQDEIETKDKERIKLNIQHAIMIKIASSSRALQELLRDAKNNGLHVAEFIREMIETTDDQKIISTIKDKNLDKVEYLGILIFGKKKVVEKLTDKLQLYK